MRGDIIKTILKWTACLVLYAVLGAGRYDWSPPLHDFALRGYILYLFFSALLFPVLYYTLADLELPKVWRLTICISLGVVYAFPHHWMHTDQYFLFRHGPTYWDWRQVGPSHPQPDWFWGAMHHLPDMPHEFAFFSLILAVGWLVIALWQKGRPSGGLHLWGRSFPFIILAVLVLQTWLHLSLRSPYTYISHYELPSKNDFWYHTYLFKDARGAVNGDYPLFRNGELVLWGDPNFLVVVPGRLLPMFISSPWSAFINPYYVWIVLNIIAWALACLAIYHLALAEFGRRCAWFSTLCMAAAQGMIVYVAQPKIYIFAISGVAILLAMQKRLFDPTRFRPVNGLLFGGICAVFLLVYDSQPWLIGLVLIAYFTGYNVRWTLRSLGLALIIYQGYFVLVNQLPQLALTSALMGNNPWDNITGMLVRLDVFALGRHLFRCLYDFLVVMMHAFNFCLVPALGGLFFLPPACRRYWALLSIAVPAFLTYAFFDLGSSDYYIQAPRLVYQAYPLVYILCGLGLARLSEHNFSSRWPRLGTLMAALIMLSCFAWVNADAFGHPAIYFYWFYRWKGYA